MVHGNEKGFIIMQNIAEKYYLCELFELLQNIEDQVFDRVTKDNLLGKNDEIEFLVRSLMRSVSLLRQITILCENGFPDGALILSRSIFEQCIISAFIEEQDDECKRYEVLDKYYADSEVSRLKHIRFQADLFSDSDVVEKTKKELKVYEEKYRCKLSNYWWSGKCNFTAIVDEVKKHEDGVEGLLNNLHMEYKLASMVIHASSQSNHINIGSDCFGIDMRARDTGHEGALFLAVASIIPVAGYTYHCLKLNEENVLGELNKLGIQYLEMLRKNSY